MDYTQPNADKTKDYILVTGASSGLGRAVAVRLSIEHNIILHGRDLDRLEETRRMCDATREHVLWSFDLQDINGIADSLTPLLAEGGRAVEAFVHCAGTVTVLPVRGTDVNVVQKMMAVNFLSAVEIVRLLLKRKYNDNRLANILFISSIWSSFGSRGHSVYCASKAALDGFMRSLAVELAPAIRANSILPGAIHTAMAEQGFADPIIQNNLKRDYPLGIGQAADIADAIEFLLSEKARWLTGQQIVIDGGRTINMSLK
jgi:NAD(P)-dependent dehydrogenase (short-subunit alcohol dehydrogenase family)